MLLRDSKRAESLRAFQVEADEASLCAKGAGEEADALCADPAELADDPEHIHRDLRGRTISLGSADGLPHLAADATGSGTGASRSERSAGRAKCVAVARRERALSFSSASMSGASTTRWLTDASSSSSAGHAPRTCRRHKRVAYSFL